MQTHIHTGEEMQAPSAAACHPSDEVTLLRAELAAAKHQIAALEVSLAEATTAQGIFPAELAQLLSTATPSAAGTRAAQKRLWGMYSTSVLRKKPTDDEGSVCASPTRGVRELARKLRADDVLPLALTDAEEDGMDESSLASASGAEAAAEAEACEPPIEVLQARQRAARSKDNAKQVVARLRSERAARKAAALARRSSGAQKMGTAPMRRSLAPKSRRKSTVHLSVARDQQCGDEVEVEAAVAIEGTDTVMVARRPRRILTKRRVSKVLPPVRM